MGYKLTRIIHTRRTVSRLPSYLSNEDYDNLGSLVSTSRVGEVKSDNRVRKEQKMISLRLLE